MLTEDKRHRIPYIIDLARDSLDKRGQAYVIQQGLSNGSDGIDVKDYILG